MRSRLKSKLANAKERNLPDCEQVVDFLKSFPFRFWQNDLQKSGDCNAHKHEDNKNVRSSDVLSIKKKQTCCYTARGENS